MGSMGIEDVATGQRPLGLLISEINIFRAPGDVNNHRTFDFPMIQEMAKDSLLVRLVSSKAYDQDFIDNFVAAGQELVNRGAVGIITSCGFLVLAQKEYDSGYASTVEIPSIRTIMPPEQAIGILTFDGSRLNETHLKAIGINDMAQIYITGPPQDGEMKKYIRDGAPYDFSVLEAEVVSAALAHIKRHPDIGVLVLECTQFPPFAHGVQQATGLPVYDVYTLGRWLYSAIARTPFSTWTEEEVLDAKQRRTRSKRELLEHSSVPGSA
ncbi:hypothetical protein LTR97_011340 [Elasticomyces elasticus]|uniref:Aspartate/glutamate racemase family protein n=1 Tax=Elasticomyces elasticus TaxID=574655 RepID=A0AAN7VZN8_9PEZI|nr:hypothetical protein LTR97_011340 [Elasticomyces elasticus]